MAEARTLFDKIWDSHVVERQEDGTCLIYIDRHLVHEVTSPQAFEGLRETGRKVRRPDATLAVPDHNVPTTDRSKGIAEEQSRIQVETLQQNCREFGVQLFDVEDIRQGIVHIIGPEQGFTLPGTTIVCGDSHTSTHGAFGALAFGIGTSEVEHVLATQTLLQKRPLNMRISVEGALPFGVTAKDVILAIIGKIGTAGGTGHVIEYAGEVVRGLSMAGRMTICNMSIEAGARAGLIAPDETTFRYLQGRPMAPKAGAFEQAVAHWQSLPSDHGARYDKEVALDAQAIEPQVTWGTSPQDVQPVSGKVPDPASFADERRRAVLARAADVCPYLVAADVLITDHSSAGFEYLLLDRPIVRIHLPELIALANIHRDYVDLLAEVSESVTGVADALGAVERALASPRERSATIVGTETTWSPTGAVAPGSAVTGGSLAGNDSATASSTAFP